MRRRIGGVGKKKMGQRESERERDRDYVLRRKVAVRSGLHLEQNRFRW